MRRRLGYLASLAALSSASHSHGDGESAECDRWLSFASSARGKEEACKTQCQQIVDARNCTQAAVNKFCTRRASIDQQHTKTVTLYHVTPPAYGLLPADMNLDDDKGALFRAMMFTWLKCGAATRLGCDNAEQRRNDLVITKLTVEVDQRFGNYQKCNVCQGGHDQGYSTQQDPNAACTMVPLPEYRCHCDASSPEYDAHGRVCQDSDVGQENVFDKFESVEDKLTSKSPPHDFYLVNAATKLDGYWYSLLTAGLCSETSAWCSWRLAPGTNFKRVNKTCADNSIFSYIEQKGDKESKRCFRKCGYTNAGKHSLAVSRNTSSPCWLDCLVSIALGPKSSTTLTPKSGLKPHQLIQAWNRPFESENASLGGCPALPLTDDSASVTIGPGTDNSKVKAADPEEKWKAHHYALAIAAGCFAVAGLCMTLKLCFCIKHRSTSQTSEHFGARQVVMTQKVGPRFSTEQYWGAAE